MCDCDCVCLCVCVCVCVCVSSFQEEMSVDFLAYNHERHAGIVMARFCNHCRFFTLKGEGEPVQIPNQEIVKLPNSLNMNHSSNSLLWTLETACS